MKNAKNLPAPNICEFRGFANLCENKVLAKIKCYTVICKFAIFDENSRLNSIGSEKSRQMVYTSLGVGQLPVAMRGPEGLNPRKMFKLIHKAEINSYRNFCS